MAPIRRRQSLKDSSWRTTAAIATRAGSEAVHPQSARSSWTVAPATRRHSSRQWSAAAILGESCNIARELCNEPSNVLTPSRLRRPRRRRLARSAGLSGRGARRGRDRATRHGPAARRRARQRRTAARDRHAARSARRTSRAGPRAGRQGHHVRHRRHLDQAGRRHGADEGRHGRRRRRRSARMRAIALLKAPIRVIGVVPTTENMPGGRAIKPGDVLTGRERQDGRGHQHRRRGPADPRRRALVRAAARRDAPRRRRHADRRVRRRARQGRVGPVRPA